MEALFSYSLRKYLDEYFNEISRALIIEDGISLTGLPKPFATIEYLGSTDEILSAGRKSYEEQHRYQLGLFASSTYERGNLSEKFRQLLIDPEGVPIYDIATGLKTDGRFVVDISEFTPIASSDNSNETFQNHGYFIVEIEILRDYGSTIFTQ